MFDDVAFDDVAFENVTLDDVAFDDGAIALNLHNKHMRAKRSTGSKSLDLKFKAHSR